MLRQYRHIALGLACSAALSACASAPQQATDQHHKNLIRIAGLTYWCSNKGLIDNGTFAVAENNLEGLFSSGRYNESRLRYLAEQMTSGPEPDPSMCREVYSFNERQARIRKANNQAAQQYRDQMNQINQSLGQDQAVCNTIGTQTFCTRY